MIRRELLKLMAASVPAFAAGCNGFMAKQQTDSVINGVPASVKILNVIFEGPMIFLMENPQVRVLVPRVDGHRYRIEGRSAAASTFTLKGVTGPGDVSRTQYEMPQGSDAFRLSAGELHLSLDLAQEPYFTFLLPAPNRVVALSSREADIVDALGRRRTAVMPTSYAFVYDVANGGLALDPNPGWSPAKRVIQERFTNLTVATGLDGNALDPAGHHARAAFAAMTGYFPGLAMQFFESGVEMQTGSVEGLPPELIRGHNVANRDRGRAGVVSAVYNAAEKRPRLVLTGSVVDCTVGGIVVTKP